MSTGPAWSGAFDRGALQHVISLPFAQVREWAFGGSTGAGVKVAVIDSGVDADHPRVGGVAGGVAFELDAAAEYGFVENEGPHGDLVGHGTACAGIIRSIAPDAEIYSVRVLGANLKGRGALLHAGVEWSVERGMHVANLSLSSKAEAMFGPLHEVADQAYFSGTTLVCAANNLPGPTYPSQYASVISVAARAGAEELALAYNPDPPVEFGARGIDVDVAWAEHGSITATGNSFAAPHVTAHGGADARQAPLADTAAGQGGAARSQRQQRPRLRPGRNKYRRCVSERTDRLRVAEHSGTHSRSSGRGSPPGGTMNEQEQGTSSTSRATRPGSKVTTWPRTSRATRSRDAHRRRGRRGPPQSGRRPDEDVEGHRIRHA